MSRMNQLRLLRIELSWYLFINWLIYVPYMLVDDLVIVLSLLIFFACV
jgi:hypothetical protein